MSNQIQEIKSRLDLVEFVSQYVKLKPTGKNLRGLCPFHQEKTPSFFVSPERQSWHCFGCSRGGDIFSFLMEKETLAFPEALKILAERAGVKLSAYSQDEASFAQVSRLIEVLESAKLLYQHLLNKHPSGAKARQYLQERGINHQITQEFELGYSANSWNAVGRALIEQKKFSPQDLLAAGLIVAKTPKSSRQKKPISWYDRFRNRVMFPIRDHLGRTVGFSARLLNHEQESAKYINTPETALFKKGGLLYGLYQARNAIRQRDYAILVEGTLDVISLHQHGLTNALAPLGTGITEQQLKLIKRFTNRVLVCFDADEAGGKATLRAIKLGLQHGLEMKIASITHAKDPDEAIQKNPTQFKEDLKQAQTVFNYLVQLGQERFNFSETVGKQQFAQFILPFIHLANSQIAQDDYIQRIAEILAVSENSIRLELEKLSQKRTQLSPHPPDNSPTPNKPPRKARNELIAEYLIAMLLQTPPTLFNDAQLIDLVEQIKPEYLSQKQRPTAWPILQALIKQLMAKPRQTQTHRPQGTKSNLPARQGLTATATGINHHALDSELNQSAIELVNLLALQELGIIANNEDSFLQTLEETIQELKTVWLKQKMAQITRQLRRAQKEGDTEKITALKTQFNQLSAQLSY